MIDTELWQIVERALAANPKSRTELQREAREAKAVEAAGASAEKSHPRHTT
jgi:hypothetical protein